jgi:transcriptional regulator with XRE-family HTH domain
MKFGQIIKKRRNSLGISQEELSNLTGLSQFRVGEIEREAKDNILLEELCHIGKALQINKVKAWIELDKEL